MLETHKTQTTNRSDFMSTVAPLPIWTSDWRALALKLSCVLTLQGSCSAIHLALRHRTCDILSQFALLRQSYLAHGSHHSYIPYKYQYNSTVSVQRNMP